MGHIQRRDLDSEVRLPVSARAVQWTLVPRALERALAAEQENLTLIAYAMPFFPGLLSAPIRVREAIRTSRDRSGKEGSVRPGECAAKLRLSVHFVDLGLGLVLTDEVLPRPYSYRGRQQARMWPQLRR